MEPKLALGMAIYDDFEGFWMTVQSFRMNHPELSGQVELIVVDNNFNSPHSVRCQELVGGTPGHGDGWVTNYFSRVVYQPFTAFSSTAQTRNRIFELAIAPLVVVTDPHIIYPRITIRLVKTSGFKVPDGTPAILSISPFVLLLSYVEANPDRHNLLQGVYLMDDLNGLATHFDNGFRDNMLGTWGHSDKASDPFGEPFSMYAQGLGFFACRRADWLEIGGFNPQFRGFGGEEGYIHEKFRIIGQKKNALDDWKPLILPFWRGVHRFGHTNGTPYPNKLSDRVRNYLIGAKELSLLKDDPGYQADLIGRIYRHFVLGENEDSSRKTVGNLPEDVWNLVISDVFPELAQQGVGQSVVTPDTEEVTPGGSKTKSAMNAKVFQDLWESMNGRRSTIKAKMVKEESWNPEPLERKLDVVLQKFDVRLDSPSAIKVYTETTHYYPDEGLASTLAANLNNRSKENTDLVVIGGIACGENLQKPFEQACLVSSRFIAVYGTATYGTVGPTTQHDESVIQAASIMPPTAFTTHRTLIGLLPVIRSVIKRHPEWSVIHDEPAGDSTDEYSGYILLACRPEDKPKPPSLVKSAANFLKSMASHISSGMGLVSEKEYQTRLTICSICPKLTANNACSICGCPVDRKAKLASAACDLGKWADKHYISQAEEIMEQENLVAQVQQQRDLLNEAGVLRQQSPVKHDPPFIHRQFDPNSPVVEGFSGGCGCGGNK